MLNEEVLFVFAQLGAAVECEYAWSKMYFAKCGSCSCFVHQFNCKYLFL